GVWNVVVSNADGQTGTLVSGFTITTPAPTVTSITPSTSLNTGPVTISNLAGTNYQTGAIVNLTRSGYPNITATSVVVSSATQITCVFPITGGASGVWNVVVMNPDGQTGTLSNGFTITAAAPTVTSITPSTALNTGPVTISNLAGTNYQTGAVVNLTRSGYSNITATSVVVSSGTQITCMFPITGAISGVWNVMVTNPDGQTGTLLSGFTIMAQILTITATSDSGGLITPAGNITLAYGGDQTFSCSATPGNQLMNLSIDGMLISPNATYTFTNVTVNHTLRVLTTPTTTLSANFANSTTTGILPLNVTFTDTSIGDPTWWSWNFGDTTPNVTIRNPSHSYTSGGLYQATLIIRNTSSNQTAYHRQNVTIVGKHPINPSYTANPMNGTAPLLVNFIDISTGDDITSRYWNFGDGTSGNGTVINHTYTDGGSYLSSLLVTSLWDNATINKTIQVTGTSPTYIINATADSGGTINPSGLVLVAGGANQTFNITPSVGFLINNVMVDGNPVGPLPAYQFTNVSSHHTINASFRVISPTTPVDLGSAENFVILAKSGVTTIGTTAITGNMGLSPIASGAITGFGLSMDPSNQFSVSSLVVGRVYAADYLSPTPAMLTTAVSNMEAAYTEAAGRVPSTATELYAGNLGGRTLAPGVYKWSTGVLIPTATDLTLDAGGDEDAVWIFQIAEDLTMGYASHVVLINGAQAARVYWQIGGETGVTIGPGAHAEGNILAQKAITMDSGASLHGRALAQTAVTLISNTITRPNLTPSLTITASADSGGMITPQGNITVPYGGDQTFSCSATTGYHLKNLSIDGILRSPNGTYTFSNVTVNHTIRVLTTPINTNLTANFTNSTTTGLIPLNVTFTDTSTGEPTWWSWHFGDASPNVTARNPVHAYLSGGPYQVTLSIGNATTNQTTYRRQNLTLVGKKPINSSFTANPMSGIAPLTVNFTDTSTGDDITSSYWTFGDGTDGNGSVITHTYANGGSYLSSLLVTSLWHNATISKTIQVTAPGQISIINATSDAGGNISPSGFVNVTYGGSQVFSCRALAGFELHSLLIDGLPTAPASSYTFTNVTALHSIRVITARIYPNIAASFNNSQTTGLLPLLVQFTDTSTGLPDRWQWNFGDGTANLTSQSPSHLFSSNGSYPVTLTVGNTTSGRSGSYQRSLQILGKSPVNASFNANQTEGPAPMSVQFTDTSTGDDLLVRNWTFGDGTTSLVLHPVHSYSQPGLYTVSLNVASPYGTSTTTRPGLIHVSAPVLTHIITATANVGGSISPSGSIPVVSGGTQSFTIIPAPGYDLTDISVDGTSQGPLGAYTFINVTTPHTIRASFSIIPSPPGKHTIIATSDRGSTIQPSGIIEIPIGSAQTFSIWPGAGYQLGSVVVDGLNQGPVNTYVFSNISADHTISVNSSAVGLVADFIGTPLAGRSPLVVNFTDMSLGGPTNWFWRFGDGTFSTDENPVHTFTRSGRYTVSLLVKNPGGSMIKTQKNYITISDREWIIEADTGQGGTLSPSGNLTYPEGTSQTFTLRPSGGYRITDLIVDGASQGPQPTYTFTNIVQKHRLSARFGIIRGDTPVITGVSPAKGVQGTARQDVTITGKNFEQGARVSFTLGSTNLTYGSVINTGQVLQVKELNLTAAPTGVYDVQVLNPSGLLGLLPAAFTITGPTPPIPAPIITGITPDRIVAQSPVASILIIGQNFYGGERVEFRLLGSTPYSFTGVRSGQNLTLLAPNLISAVAGMYDVTVTNLTTGLNGTKTGGFIIETRPSGIAPVVLGVTPSTAPQGSTIPVFTVLGQNFGSSDRIELISGGVIALSLPAVFSDSHLILTNVSVASIPPGGYDLWVINATTGLRGYKQQAFSVIGDISRSYTINGTSNGYGVISPGGVISVRAGETVVCTLKAKPAATLSHLTVDGQPVPIPAEKQYAFTNVNANHTIHLDATPDSGVVFARFQANSTGGSVPLTVQFTDSSSGSPTQWSWNFGDGKVSNLQNPIHVYTRAGSFTVSLYARNSMSNNMKREKNCITVNNPPGIGVTPILSSGVSSRGQVTDGETPNVLVPSRQVLAPSLYSNF
ncbi:MAG TPA: PKD domain-containing protein, partial [Methanospirillum sp.]|nr:PKD domain-containing protein [Methanospirillum sp.]